MNKVIFWDRDGVIIEDKEFVYKISDMEIKNDFVSVVSVLQKAGYFNIIVTNQSGIERGYFTLHDFWCFQNELVRRLKKKCITITDVFFCQSANNKEPRRKPNPDMLLEAIKKHNVDTLSSWMVGDKDTDIEAGKRAGLKTIYLKNPQYLYKSKLKPDYEIVELTELLNIIIQKCIVT